MILQILELKQYFNLADYPVSIVADGTKGTITLANHNFKTGDYLNITGTSTSMDGIQLITNRPNANSLEFATTYTGTKTAVIKQNETILTNIISQVENYIKNFCDLEYGNTSEATEIYDLKTNGIVLPKRGRIVESDVKSIKLSRENNFTDATKFITLTSEDYFVYDDYIELKFEKCLDYINCRKSVKLTYTTQACPDGLKYIAMQIAEYHYRNFSDKSIVETNRSINGDQRTFAKTLPQQVIDDLMKYQRVSIGDPY